MRITSNVVGFIMLAGAVVFAGKQGIEPLDRARLGLSVPAARTVALQHCMTSAGQLDATSALWLDRVARRDLALDGLSPLEVFERWGAPMTLRDLAWGDANGPIDLANLPARLADEAFGPLTAAMPIPNNPAVSIPTERMLGVLTP